MNIYRIVHTVTQTVTNRILLDDPNTYSLPPGYELVFEGKAPDPPFKGWSVLEFKRRFTTEERVAIHAATENPMIRDYMDFLNSAQVVLPDDTDTYQGIQYLEFLGLIGSGRALEILTPP